MFFNKMHPKSRNQESKKGRGTSRRRDDGLGNLFAGEEGVLGERREYVLDEKRKLIIDYIKADGINTEPYAYLVVNDGGVDTYYAGLYIDQLPKSATIAVTFRDLFNADDVTSSVVIDPLGDESIKRINKRVKMLSQEKYSANKNDDVNRIREIEGKFQEANEWASRVERGVSSFYEVSYLFLVRAESYQRLRVRVADLVNKAGNSLLASCYAAQLEAFTSAGPFNEIFAVSLDEKGRLSRCPVKKHMVDEDFLTTNFNHTHSEFFHENGVILGHNIYSAMPVTFDPFDKTHFSYGIIVAGMPGYGKSAAVKMMDSRLVDFGVHIANIDFEPLPGNGKCGEYSVLAEACGGVNYLISNNSDHRLNFFEVGEELDYDPKLDTEYRVLNLEQKIINMTNILMVVATAYATKTNVTSFQPETYGRMEKIVSNCVRKIYAKRGIVDGDPESLYESSSVKSGFSSGRRKKELPQMHDFYVELLLEAAGNKDRYKTGVYNLLLDIFEERVRELYYCPECFREFTAQEMETIPYENGKRCCPYHEMGMERYAIHEVRGSKSYMDCQSTVTLDIELPYHNFDLSQITDVEERKIMIMVCQSYLEENFIKKNSMNPRKKKKLIISTDEAHRILPLEGARRYINDLYRVARKRLVAPRLILHSVADFSNYPESEELMRLTETFMLFRHKTQEDRDALTGTVELTGSQADGVMELGGSDRTGAERRYGEFLLVDIPTRQSVFVQVDYLKETEFKIVETDVQKIADAMNAGRSYL